MFKFWFGYVNVVVDIFFIKEIFVIVSVRGSDRKGKSGDVNILLIFFIIDVFVGK